MKRGAARFVGRRRLALAAAIMVWGLFAPAHCQAQQVLLLLEQTPVKGGKITPVAGVHHFKPGSEVVLSASPKPGYQFVHWLGDVSDAKARSTVVYLDEPKVIVAVFEQADYGAKDILAGGGGGGGGGLMPTAGNFFLQNGINAGGGGGGKPPQGPIVYTKEPIPQVPEPATGVLLVTGTLFALARRRARRAHLNL
ncbi:MAG: InlB B-repeat-containing protein [Planctomycetota bacterium]